MMKKQIFTALAAALLLTQAYAASGPGVSGGQQAAASRSVQSQSGAKAENEVKYDVYDHKRFDKNKKYRDEDVAAAVKEKVITQKQADEYFNLPSTKQWRDKLKKQNTQGR